MDPFIQQVLGSLAPGVLPLVAASLAAWLGFHNRNAIHNLHLDINSRLTELIAAERAAARAAGREEGYAEERAEVEAARSTARTEKAEDVVTKAEAAEKKQGLSKK